MTYDRGNVLEFHVTGDGDGLDKELVFAFGV